MLLVKSGRAITGFLMLALCFLLLTVGNCKDLRDEARCPSCTEEDDDDGECRPIDGCEDDGSTNLGTTDETWTDASQNNDYGTETPDGDACPECTMPDANGGCRPYTPCDQGDGQSIPGENNATDAAEYDDEYDEDDIVVDVMEVNIRIRH